MTREGLIALLEECYAAADGARGKSFATSQTRAFFESADALVAAIPDILAALRDDGWRPIESAPEG